MSSPAPLAPSHAAVAWCIARICERASPGPVLELLELVGGLEASTYRLTFLDGAEVRTVVLRRFLEQRPREELESQHAAFRALPRLDWPTLPELLAADPFGEFTEHPTFVLSLVPGQAQLQRNNLAPRLEQLARALVCLHQGMPSTAAGVPRLARSSSRLALPPVEDACLPAAEALAFALADLPRTSADDRLIHSDFHIGNTLFDGERLRGVVDWGTARIGPPEFDVAYCHLDLTLVYGPEAARAFLAHYEALAGHATQQFDLWTLSAASRAYPDPVAWLPSWHAWGLTDLSANLIRQRLSTLVRSALERVASTS